MKKIKIAIDATRNRSGGARIHLIELLKNFQYEKYNLDKIYLWSYPELLNKIPDYPWLKKYSPFKKKVSILKELHWQNRKLPKILKKLDIDILLNTTATSVCYFKPNVTMSRDMLSFEKGIIKKSGFSIGRLRLILLKHIQKISLKNANGVIFLTKYASSVLQSYTGSLKNFKIINHGISQKFFIKKPTLKDNKKLRCIYVSNIDFYKHQSNVVKALSRFKENEVELVLAGGPGNGAPALIEKKKLDKAIAELSVNFVTLLGHVKHNEIPALYRNCDIIIFASSCENMPNTLVEGMASGLPIASSNLGPMPEILKDAGNYFDPNNIESIYQAVKPLVESKSLRDSLSSKSYELSKQFSWEKCSDKTFDYIIDTYKNKKMYFK